MIKLWHAYNYFQVLGITTQPGDIIAEFNAFYHLPPVPALPVHSHLCPARYAAVWWSVQFWGGNAAHQLQYIPHCTPHSLPSKLSLRSGFQLQLQLQRWIRVNFYIYCNITLEVKVPALNVSVYMPRYVSFCITTVFTHSDLVSYWLNVFVLELN